MGVIRMCTGCVMEMCDQGVRVLLCVMCYPSLPTAKCG